MDSMPVLMTQRLCLRPFTLADAGEVQRLAGDREVAATTLNMPHPYEDGMAEEWIQSHAQDFKDRKTLHLAITRQEDDQFLGDMTLHVQQAYSRGELAYFVGRPYWNKGYGTEAAGRMLAYAFEELGLNRVFACYMRENFASKRVMEKLGMVEEGCLKQHVMRFGRYHDIVYMGILRDDYEKKGTPNS